MPLMLISNESGNHQISCPSLVTKTTGGAFPETSTSSTLVYTYYSRCDCLLYLALLQPIHLGESISSTFGPVAAPKKQRTYEISNTGPGITTKLS